MSWIKGSKSSTQASSLAETQKSNEISSDRAELALLEGQFINALLDLAPAPRELDSKQISVCGRAIKDKRARTINRFLQRKDPGEQRCECGITEEMEDYFRQFPGVHPDGPFADFRRYKRFLTLRRLKSFFSRFYRLTRCRLRS